MESILFVSFFLGIVLFGLIVTERFYGVTEQEATSELSEKKWSKPMKLYFKTNDEVLQFANLGENEQPCGQFATPGILKLERNTLGHISYRVVIRENGLIKETPAVAHPHLGSTMENNDLVLVSPNKHGIYIILNKIRPQYNLATSSWERVA